MTIEFEIRTPYAVLSDPCYLLTCINGSYQAVMPNVKPGTYVGFIDIVNCGSWGDRIKKLYCFNKNYFVSENLAKSLFEKMSAEDLLIELSVDSGQLGIFDLDYAKQFSKDDYEKVCDLTLSDKKYGATENSIVSSSGFGDGGYLVAAVKNAEGS